MIIYIASDHAGFALKETLKQYLHGLNYRIEDCGAFEENEDDDYPDYILPCARHVASDPGSFGIVLGASGQGEAMVANRIPGVRAVVYYGPVSFSQVDASGNSLDIIQSTRIHNDANILSLGARFVTEDEAKEAVSTFLDTPFSADERHMRRIRKF